jgi:hypothetical protein
VSLTLSPTGSSIGDYENLTAFEVEAGSHRTQIKSVPNPGLREVLIGFVEAFREPLAPLRGFVRRSTAVDPTKDDPGTNLGSKWMPWQIALVIGDDIPSRIVTLLESTQVWEATPLLELHVAHRAPFFGTDDAVATIDELAKRVGLPIKDVLAAAGVKKSTYHSWKAPGAPTPRLASQGKLWEVAQFVEDFAELLGGPIRPWLHAEQSRRQLFITGRFTELHELIRSQPRPRVAAPDYAALAAIGGDRLTSDSESEPPRKPRGQPGTIQRVKAADRHRS